MDETPTTAQLLEQWRDATRAADLAERLASVALASAEQADRNAVASEEIAKMAERAARSAERAAERAREAATRARQWATENRSLRLQEADDEVVAARQAETDARHRYHEAERAARDRQNS